MTHTISTTSAIEALVYGASIKHIAEKTGWPIVDDCLVPEPGKWHATDGNAEITIECDSAEQAAQEYVEEGEWGDDRSETTWITVHVWREGIDADGDIVRVDEATHKITLEAEEPPCKDGHTHMWAAPYAILGGLEENPGVQGSGGGVVITEVCLRCGCAQITDTWAQDPTDGEQGLNSTKYIPGKYSDEVQTLLERKVTFDLEPALDAGSYLIIARLDYRGFTADATYVVEEDSAGYSENLTDTDEWPGPGYWPDPPRKLIAEAKEML